MMGNNTTRRSLLRWAGAVPVVAAAGVAVSPGPVNASAPGAVKKAAPRFASLPPGARPLPVPAQGYRLERVGDALYVVTASAVQSAFLVTDAGVVVIDAPQAHEAFLPAAIRQVTKRPVTHQIYTHNHADHIGSSAVFGDITRIAHQETARLLRANADPARPLPAVTFADSYTLHVGGQVLRLSYPGTNHEAGNILIHAPRQRAAMMVDLVPPGWSPFRAFGPGDSVPGVYRAVDQLLTMDIETYIGGHVHRLGTPRDLQVSHEFLQDLWNSTSAAIAGGSFADAFAAVEPGNQWAGFNVFLEAVADTATPGLISRWVQRLGGVDVWTRENVITVALSQMLDAPKSI